MHDKSFEWLEFPGTFLTINYVMECLLNTYPIDQIEYLKTMLYLAEYLSELVG